MKSVLLPMNETGGLSSMLEIARQMSTNFEAHVEGFYQRRSLPDIMAAGAADAASPALLDDLEKRDNDVAVRARAAFEEAMKGRSAVWREEQARDIDVSERARAFDVTVIGRPTDSTDSPSMSTLEAVLFESGRPLLIAPPEAPGGFGECVAVLWNGSTETARTIAMGMPFLARASKILVLTIEGAFVPGPTAGDIAENLARHGFDVEATERPRGRRGTGEAMIDEAAKFGADLLFKGGYTSSRIRQMIFGGPTSHILAESGLPVLMAH